MTTVKERNQNKNIFKKLLKPKNTSGLFEGWSKFEITWLSVFTAITIYLYFAFDDTLLGLVSSISGMLAVVLVAKGKISNYVFGTIQAVTYGYIAYTYGLYGEASLNILFYLPTQIIGFMMWKNFEKSKVEAKNGEDIHVKRLTKKGIVITLVAVIVGAFAYAEILYFFNAQQVRIDSFAVVLSITAQILMLKRYAEQWILWIIVNILSITLWVITLLQTGGNDWNMVVMWSAFLLNSVWGYINWLKLSK